MSAQIEFLVIGGGAMGSAASYFLAAAGHEVLLLERFDPGHANGASHGRTRNFNPAYSHPDYVRLLQRANTLWDEVSQRSGVQLLNRTGLVSHGDVSAQHAAHRALQAVGFDSRLLRAEEAEERFTGMKFSTETLFVPEGGQLDADLAVSTFQQLAAQSGARVQHRQRVTGITVCSDAQVKVRVQGDQGTRTISASKVIVTAGAWTRPLLGSAFDLPQLFVTEEHPVHFALKDSAASWPGFNHVMAPSQQIDSKVFAPIYGMYTPGEGLKVGWHGSGRIIDPEHRPHEPVDEQIQALQDYAERWLPGVDAQSFEPVSCTYANTDDEDFILDRLGPVTVGAGFSGHGFKFVPAIGEYLAALATGRARAIGTFSVAHRSGSPVFSQRRAQAGIRAGSPAAQG